MKKGKKIALFVSLGVVLVALAIVLAVMLSSGHRVIKVNSFEGEVVFERNSAEKDIVQGMNLKSKDSLTTGEDGLIELLVDMDKHILARENTCFEIVSQGNEEKGKLKINLKYGTALIEIENKLNEDSFVEVETPNASLSVRGTTFEVSYSEENKTTIVEVTEGMVEISNGDDTKEINAGQIGIVSEDNIVIEDSYLQYSEVPAFQVGHPEKGRISDVYVKELVEWNYEITGSEDMPIDEMVRDDIRICYWYETEEEVQENLEFLENNDYLQSTQTLINDDGDDILVVISGVEDANGGLNASYKYQKEIKDGWYINLTIYSVDNPNAVVMMDIEDFLPLTNDCYYFFGLPESVENTTDTVTGDVEPDDGDTPVEDDTFVMGDVQPGTIVAEDDVAKLFANEITYDELIFMLRVLEGARANAPMDITNTGLNMVWHEPELSGVYSPISGTAYEYDVATLNRLFSVFTTIMISENNIPSYVTLNGDTLTMEPCTLEDFGNVTISVYSFNFVEDNKILIEYEYVRTNDSSGTSGVKGNSCVRFTPDANGKYNYEYSMEYSSSSF